MSKNTKSPLSLTYIKIRKLIGVLAMSLPIVVFLVEKTFFHVDLQPSISAFYYTEMRWFFVLTLCFIGFFLFFYQGYDDLDKWMARVAGVGAFLTAMFPTSNPHSDYCASPLFIFTPTVEVLSVSYENLCSVTETIHLLSAATMFVTIAIFSLFRFTKCGHSSHKNENLGQRKAAYKQCRQCKLEADSGSENAKRKILRNRIYVGSGVVIFISIFLMGLSSLWEDVFAYTVYVGEFVALFAFGVSWAVKGEWLWLRDVARPKSSTKFNQLQKRQVDGYKSGMGIVVFLIAVWFTTLLYAARVPPFNVFEDTGDLKPVLGFEQGEAQAILMGILFLLVVIVFYFILNYQVLSLFWPLVRRKFRLDLGDDTSGEMENLWMLFSKQSREMGFSMNLVIPQEASGISHPSTLAPEKSYLSTFLDILSWIIPRVGYSLRAKKLKSSELGVGLLISIMNNTTKDTIAEKTFWTKNYGIVNANSTENGDDCYIFQLLMIPAFLWFAEQVDIMDGFEPDEDAREAKANYYLGMTLWHKDLDQGINFFSKSISYKPDHWPAYAALGRLWTEKSQAIHKAKMDEIAKEYLLLANGYLATVIQKLTSQGELARTYFAASYNQIVAWKYLIKLVGQTGGLDFEKALEKGENLREEAKNILEDNMSDPQTKSWLKQFLPTLEFVLQNLVIETQYSKDINAGLTQAIEKFVELGEVPVNLDQPLNPIAEGGRHFVHSFYRTQYNVACFYSQLASMTSDDGEKSTYVNLALDHLDMALSRGGGLIDFAQKDSSLDAVRGEERFKKITKSEKQAEETKEMEESKLHVVHYQGKKDDGIDCLPGISDTTLQKFSDLGITNRTELLLKGCDTKSRKDLAKKTEVDNNLLLWWLNLCDLMRVQGVTLDFAMILEGRGKVDTIKELRRRNAGNLHIALDKIFPEELLQIWINASKELTPILEYD
jgi:hypothetical protein